MHIYIYIYIYIYIFEVYMYVYIITIYIFWTVHCTRSIIIQHKTTKCTISKLLF